jgi:8-oxo-dGTP pyrophosphatase MutT (NUDIX family)
MTTGPNPRTRDVLHRCLEHPVRRAVLCALVERTDETTTLEALVDELAERTGLDANRLRIELHHVHLPKLSTLDAVEFDHRSGDVRFHPEFPTSRFVEQELVDD